MVSESDVNAILVRLAAFEATVTSQLAGITTDNTRGEGVHQDHENRLRALERFRWAAVGMALCLGGGSGAALSQLLGR